MFSDLDYYKDEGFESTATATGTKAPRILKEITGRLPDRYNYNNHPTWINLSARDLYLLQNKYGSGYTTDRGEKKYTVTDSNGSIWFNVYKRIKVSYE